MIDRNFLFGIGGLVVGLVLGIVIGGNQSHEAVRSAVGSAVTEAQQASDAAAAEARAAAASAAEEARAAAAQAQVEAQAKGEAAMAALGERLAALEEAVAKNADAASGLADEMGSKLSDFGDRLEKGLGQTAERVAALASGAGGGTESAADDMAAEDTAADGTTPPEGIRAGSTEVLADGAVRVFVSRVDEEDGYARLSINGVLQTVPVGDTVTVSTDGGECSVTLDAVDRSHAKVSGACGEGASAEAASEPAAEAGPGEALSVGQVTTLADGRIRVFLSGVTAAGAARIAVNGLELIGVDPGGRVDAPTADGTPCHVTVTGVEDGKVSVAGACE